MSEKNFLESLTKDKPESFQEEKREKVIKEKKPLNIKLIIATLVVLVVLFVLSYIFFFAPKITMQDFVNKPKKELTAFLRQQGIDPSGVVLKETYSLDVDRDHVVSQSIAPGKKINKNTKIDFVISLGADPDELISLPDFNTMTPDAIREWIKTNKAINARINLVFDENVKENEIIKVDVKNDSEYHRKDKLVINISKGQEPAKKVAVPDFKNLTIDAYEEALKKVKLKLVKIESFNNDEKIGVGSVVRVSPEVGKTVLEGESVTAYYAAGQSIVIPDLVNMTSADAKAWFNKNASFNIIKEERYSDSGSYVIHQSLRAGTTLSNNGKDKLEVVISKGKPKIGKVVGEYLDDIKEKINEINAQGYDLAIGEWETNRVYVKGYEKGKIVTAECKIHETTKFINCGDSLPNKARFIVTVSKGNIYQLSFEDASTVTNSEIAQQLSNFGITYEASVADINTLSTMKIMQPSDVKGGEVKVIDLNTNKSDLLNIEIYEGAKVEFY